MKTFASFIRYMGERETIFRYEEYGFAKHAHFQDKQKCQSSMALGE